MRAHRAKGNVQIHIVKIAEILHCRKSKYGMGRNKMARNEKESKKNIEKETKRNQNETKTIESKLFGLIFSSIGKVCM